MGKTIVFTGDSITDCGRMFEKDNLGNGYVRMIHDALPDDLVINSGWDGYIASRMYGSWSGLCTHYKPDIVTILVGINDVHSYITGGGGYDEHKYAYYIRKLIDKTQEECGSEIILMDPFLFPKPAEFKTWMPAVERFRSRLDIIAEEYKLRQIHLGDIFAEAMTTMSVDELTIDGIHLTEKGHSILADAWMDMYRRQLQEGTT